MIDKSSQSKIDICALRYALGRSTYVVGEVCSYIKYKAMKNEYDQNTIKIMLRDISQYFYELANVPEIYKFECDISDWNKLYETLIELVDGFPGWFSEDLEKFVKESVL